MEISTFVGTTRNWCLVRNTRQGLQREMTSSNVAHAFQSTSVAS